MAWQQVAAASEVPVGGTHLAEIDGTPVCVVRLGEDVVKAIHDTCSHEDEPLHEGWVEDNTVECPAHGSTFDLDSGEPEVLPAVKPLPVYAATVADGVIWVDLEQQRNDAEEPAH